MNERNKLIITWVAFGVGILGMLVWVYLQMSTIGKEPFAGEDSLATKIKKVNKSIELEDNKIELIPLRKEEYQKLRNDQELARQLLPQENDPAELMHFITVKAREANVQTVSLIPTKVETKNRGGLNLQVQAASSGPKFEEWQYAMKLAGSFDEIGTFINKMEEFEIAGTDEGREARFFAVKDIEIIAEGSGVIEAKASHKVRLTMVTYRYMGDTLAPGMAGLK